MFIGTTMAWFTDSVTSGVNKIVAGNLDIEVEYKKPNGSWATLEGASTLFSTEKWEPGHTEVVYLKVTNAGTLGLNYKVLVTPVNENGGVNVNNQSFKLSDYLVFGTTTPDVDCPSYTREQARDAVGTTTGLADANALTKEGTMNAGDVKYLALVVYMPESVGNEANYKTGTAAPSIELGIKVVATQLTAENDSFGPDYDSGAVSTPFYTAGAYYDYFEAVNVTTNADENGNFTVTKSDENTGIIASASGTAAAGAEVSLVVTKTSTPEGNFGIRVDEGHELNGYEIKVSGQAENSVVQGKLYVGTGLENFVFYHNGTAMTLGTQGSLADGQYFYNSNDGFVYFASKSFSPFQATYKAPAASITNANGTAVYGTLADAFKAAKSGDTIVMLKDFENLNYSTTVTFSLKNGITLDGNGRAIRGNCNVYMDSAAGAVSTVKNVVFENIHNDRVVDQETCDYYGWTNGKVGMQSAIFASGLQGTANILNCTFNGVDWDAIQVTPKAGSTLNILGNTFMHSDTESTQLRYIHVQPSSKTAATLNIHNNKFYQTKNPNASSITNIGIWYVALDNMRLDGNYFEYDPSSGKIDTNSEVSASGSFSWEGFAKLFPARDASGVEVSPAAFLYKKDIAYMTLQDAIDNAKNASESIYLLRDNTDSVTISEGTARIIRLFGMKLGDLINNGTLTFENGSSTPGSANITNNGTLNLSCSEATGFKVVNNGVLNITYCGSSVAYDQNNITNNEGGQVKVTANKVYFKAPIDPSWTSWAGLSFYKCALQSNGYYAYVPCTNAEAVAEGAVVRFGGPNSTSPKFFETMQEGIYSGAVYLLKDVSESVTRDNGNVSFYGEDFTFTGSLSSSANVNIYNGTAVLDSINGVNLTFGSTYNTKGLTVTVKDGTVTGNITIYNNKTGGTTVVIEGGTYAGTITVKTGASLTIKGGTFSSDPSAYVANGYEAKSAGNLYVVSPITYWSDFAAETYATPVDEENKVVTIASAAELALFANEVNSGRAYQGYQIVINSDIDLSANQWIPLMNGGAHWGSLSGSTIDGEGHTIYGMKTYHDTAAGFISANASALTIKNLTFDGAIVKTKAGQSQSYAGVLMGKNYSPVTFENVTVKNADVFNNWQCGGFVGFAEGNGPVFKNCSTLDSHIGGNNATAGSFFGLGVVDVSLENCTAKNVQLYTDSLTWNSTANQVGNFYVGHLYPKTLTTTNCTEENVTVVNQ